MKTCICFLNAETEDIIAIGEHVWVRYISSYIVCMEFLDYALQFQTPK